MVKIYGVISNIRAGHLKIDIRDFRTILLIAGLPRARSARGTEPHTHGIWSTSFRFVVT